MRRTLASTLFFAAALGVAGAGLVVACAPGNGGAQGGAGAGGSTGGGSGGTGGGSTTGGGFDDAEPFADVGSADVLPSPDAACALITEEALAIPLDLYIALDKSQSMAGDKWDGAKAGLHAFVNDPSFTGVKVALKFFPRAPDATPACDQSAYKTPDVAFGALPGNAQAIDDAMAAESPNGFTTPTYVALGGAIFEDLDVEAQNPGEAAAVLLVTDGLPDGPAPSCGGVNPDDPTVIAALAATGLSKGVHTYVIGLPGVTKGFADQIAQAGGSGAAILVGNVDVANEFHKALAKIGSQALPCEYEIPAKVGTEAELAFDDVNVLFTPGADGGVGATTLVGQDAACKGAGWRYDDPAKPAKILLCPAFCSQLKQDFGAKIQIQLGCKTVVAK
jgi:hypothetical protein